jgi:hypothetical protein
VARQERPLDPTAGPLPSFAYDLRKLRTEAGNPTYRALAKLAGYSATTLSEAASGTRRPSLEVTLAYVGACRGDAEAWHRRWHELDAALAEQCPPAELSPSIELSSPVSSPVEDAPGGGTRPLAPVVMTPSAPPQARRRWTAARWVTIVAGVAGAVVVIVGVSGAFRPQGSPAASGGVACPPAQDGAAFTGQTYGGGAHVRTGASRDEPVVRTIPGGCMVGFRGYCVGQRVDDTTASMPDVRWFIVDGGVVSSAVIHGNPPLGLRPSSCKEGRPLPDSVSLSVAVQGDALAFTATGGRVDIVGYAVAYPDTGSAARRWHQVDLTTAPTFTASWRPPAGARQPVLVVAVACLGGDGPTDALDARSVRPGDPAATRAVLAPPDRVQAARLACQYPRRG